MHHIDLCIQGHSLMLLDVQILQVLHCFLGIETPSLKSPKYCAAGVSPNTQYKVP